MPASAQFGTSIDMAIKFSAKNQPAPPAAAAKPPKAAPISKAVEPAATDLFETQAPKPAGKTRKKK